MVSLVIKTPILSTTGLELRDDFGICDLLEESKCACAITYRFVSSRVRTGRVQFRHDTPCHSRSPLLRHPQWLLPP